MDRGKFIVVDGGEGSGKTTMIRRLAKNFPASAGKFLATREPGGTPFAEKIRRLFLSNAAGKTNAETQFGLVWAMRAEHLRGKIEPALARGFNVVSDRFDSSTFAYQIYGQQCAHLRDLFWKTREVFLRETKPDMYIFFDIEPEVGLRRLAGRGGEKTRFDRLERVFHQRVRSGFLEFLKKVPYQIIDANQPMEKVQKDFLAAVGKALK